MLTSDSLMLLFIAFFGMVLLVLALWGMIHFFSDFSKELRYLNMEIHRTTGSERRHWQRRRRRLWLSLLPFIRYR